MLTPEIEIWLQRLIESAPQLTEIWLIGSRANDTASENSDWDFIAFSTSALDMPEELHKPDVDLLVIYDGNSFSNAWGDKKSGSLSVWQWQPASEIRATYQGEKWTPDENEDSNCTAKSQNSGKLSPQTCNAYRIWLKNTTPDRCAN